jgi:hypothetical protein
MAGGQEVAVRSYNSVIEHLSSTGEIPASLFPPLAADANLDSVGIASAQLAEYLREGLPESQQEQRGKGPALVGGDSVIVNLGGLGDIAELVREHLPEWLRGKRREPEMETSSAERQETVPHAGAASQGSSARSSGEPPIARLTLPPQQTRIEELRPERQPQTNR